MYGGNNMNLNMMRGAALVNLSEDSISKHKQYFDWTAYEFGDTYVLKTDYLSPGFSRNKEAIIKDMKIDFLYHCINKIAEEASINVHKYSLIMIIIPLIVYYEKDGVYIVVILPDKSAADFPNMQLVGTNLEYLDKDNVLLQVKSSVYASYGDYYEPDFIEPLEYLIEENFLLYNWSGMRDGSWTEYCYSNDGGNTWSDVIRFEAK
jgi:hypothetical protein